MSSASPTTSTTLHNVESALLRLHSHLLISRFLRRSLCGWGSGDLRCFDLIQPISSQRSPPAPELSQSAASVLLQRRSSANQQPAFSLPRSMSHPQSFTCQYSHTVFFHPHFLSFIHSSLHHSDWLSISRSLTSVLYLYRCPFIFLQTFISSSYTSLIQICFLSDAWVAMLKRRLHALIQMISVHCKNDTHT